MDIPIEIVSTLVNQQAPELEEIPALVNTNPSAKISFSDFKGKCILLFSYPLDFTFVCPTEIVEFSNHAKTFRQNNC